MENYALELDKQILRIGNVKDININEMKIPYGKTVILEGNNGSGKSSFLSLIYGIGLHLKHNGDIYISGINSDDIASEKIRRDYISYMDQSFQFYFGYQSVKSALTIRGINSSNGNRKIKNEVKRLANIYYDKYLKNIIDYKGKNPLFINVNSLSGGQKRMVHILSYLIKLRACNNKILFMDEPLNDLDGKNKKIVIDLLCELKNDIPDLTILVVSHCRVFPSIDASIKFEEVDGNIVANYIEDGFNNVCYPCLKEYEKK